MRRTSTRVAFATLLFAVAACGTKSKNTAVTGGQGAGGPGNSDAKASELDQPTPLDPSIRTGVLPNGLTYYVKEHKQPANRAQFWLGVNAGATLEEDQQQGLAHFVEHMAFNGTKNFKKDAIVKYFESVGMKFGPDLNAYTSQDETVYMLQLPTDDQSIINTGLSILRDWAGDITFDPAEVDKERGVVVEEWRLGRGARDRIFNKQMQVIFKDSMYGKRNVIGTEKILRTAPRDELLRFYKDWYRPNLMAIVAVGDFDGAAIEKQLKETFADLKNPEKPRERKAFAVPDHDETLVTIETDAEMPQTILRVLIKNDRAGETTLRDYRNGFVRDQLFAIMVQGRLQEKGEEAAAPFLFAGASNGELTRTKGAFSVFAVAKEGKVKESLALVWEELERIKRHGFLPSELERARKSLLRNSERSAIEVEKQEGRSLAAEYLRHFFEGEQVPGRAVEYEYAKRFAPEVSIEELNAMVGTLTGKKNRVIAISGPAKATIAMPTKAAVLSVLSAVESQEIEAYAEEANDRPLMTIKPSPGAVVGENRIEEIDVTEWKLSNGVRVIVKPTNFKNDEIRFSAFSPGGSSLVGAKDYAAVRSAGSLIGFGGVGEFNRIQLGKLLAGKVANTNAYVGELEEALFGNASPRDLETMFQLLHLRFTAARKDKDSFASWKATQLEFVRNRRLSPEGAFFDDAWTAFNKNHPRRRSLTAADIEKIDLDKAYNFYRERFADASDFTFTFVGNVDLAKLRPLVEKYIASLPAAGKSEKWKDLKVNHPSGIKTTTLRRGSEPKSYVVLRFHGKGKWTQEVANDLAMLQDALAMRLREVMREDMGGVYGVRASGRYWKRPRAKWVLSLSYGCDPKRVDELKKAMFAEIKKIQKQGVSDDYVDKIKAIWTRQREVDLRTNRFWLSKIEDAYRYGEDPRTILDHAKWVDAVSSARIKAAAKRFAKFNQYHLSVLYPEKGK